MKFTKKKVSKKQDTEDLKQADLKQLEFQPKKLKHEKPNDDASFGDRKLQLDKECNAKLLFIKCPHVTAAVMDHHYKMYELIAEFKPEKVEELKNSPYPLSMLPALISKYGINLVGKALESDERIDKDKASYYTAADSYDSYGAVVRYHAILSESSVVLNESIKRSKVLSKISVDTNDLDENTEVLNDILKHNKSITTVQLCGDQDNLKNFLRGIEKITPILYNKTLCLDLWDAQVDCRFLDKLQNAPISRLSVETDDMEALLKLVTVNQGIKALKLYGPISCQRESTVLPLAQALNTTSITELDLSHHEVSYEEGLVIVKNGGQLSILNMALGEIGNAAALELKKMLEKEDCNLIDLCLESSDLESKDLKHIAAALGINRTLTYLNLGDDLGHMKLKDDAMVPLANMLRSNRSLGALKLDVNRMRSTGAKAFKNMLKENKTLLRIDLECSKYLTEQEVEEISTKVTKNYALITKSLDKYALLQDRLHNVPSPKAPIFFENGQCRLSREEAISLSQHTSCSLKSIEEKLKILNKRTFPDHIKQGGASKQEKFDTIHTSVDRYLGDNFFSLNGICKDSPLLPGITNMVSKFLGHSICDYLGDIDI